jgi:ribosomal protein S18 acetylase RimI-like enzyme
MTVRGAAHVLFIRSRSPGLGATPVALTDRVPAALADAGYLVAGDWQDRAASGIANGLAHAVKRARWADVMVVDACSGRPFWMPFLVVRIGRLLSRPTIVALGDDGLPAFARSHPRRTGSTIRMATRVVASSGVLRAHFDHAGRPVDEVPDVRVDGAEQPDEDLRAWEAALSRCGAPRDLPPASGCGPLGLVDIDAVIDIHRAAFPDSAITQLGDAVIRRYYAWQFVGPHPAPVALGVWHDGRLVGFLFGGRRHRAVVGFVHRYVGAIALGALCHPGAVRQLAVPKVMAVARLLVRGTGTPVVGPATAAPPVVDSPAPDRESVSPEAGPSFGVLSVAVSADARGTGAAAMLMAGAEQAAGLDGLTRMHLTVQTENGRAIAFYEKLGWVRKPEPDGWHGAMTKSIVGALEVAG